MAVRKSSSALFPACFLLLLTVYCCGASVTERVGLEDDEDSFTVGSFSLTFRLPMNCNGEWYYENIALFTSRLQNSIAEGIRWDCAECPFENGHLHDVLITCQPSEQSVHFRASIQDWTSDNYPVPYILRYIEFRYNGSGEVVLIGTSNFTAGVDQLSEELRLIPTNVSVQYTTVSSGSGDGETAAVTNYEITSTVFDEETSSEIAEIANTEVVIVTSSAEDLSDSNNDTLRAGKNPVSSDSVLLFLTALLASMLIRLQH